MIRKRNVVDPQIEKASILVVFASATIRMVQMYSIMAVTALSCVFIQDLATADRKRTEILDDLENITFSFDCSNRPVGFYADVEFDCQVFHMCDEKANRIPHVCANDTSFNQEFRICDWEYNFDCADAPKWYFLNELTYATDPPNEDDAYK